MRKKLTITVEEARPRMVQSSLDEGYRAMAVDEEQEREARGSGAKG